MAIFNSYVKLPEGMIIIFTKGSCHCHDWRVPCLAGKHGSLPIKKVPVPIRDSQSHGKSHVSLAVEESWSNGGGKMVHVDLDVPPKS